MLHHGNALLVLIPGVGGREQFPSEQRKKSFNSQGTLAAESFAGKEMIRWTKIWFDLREIIIFLAQEGKSPREAKGD